MIDNQIAERKISDWYDNGYSIANAATEFCHVFQPSKYGQLLDTIDGIICVYFSARQLAYNVAIHNPGIIDNIIALKCAKWLDANVYQIDHLYATESYEYNPIENYDSNFTETVEHSHTNTQTHTGDNTTVNGGNVKTTDTLSMHNVTTDSKNDITEYGKHDTATTTAIAPYDSDVMHVKDNTTVNDNSHTDSFTTNRNIDSTDNGSTISNREDNTRSTLTLDTTDDDTGHSTQTTTRTQRGNIGVTTSQQMIQSERDLVRYSAATEIATKIIDAITLSYWGSI